MFNNNSRELNYWPSFVDIFASLFFIFLILFSLYYSAERIRIEGIKKDLEEIKAFLAEDKEGLIEYDRDKRTFVISTNALFDTDKSELKTKGKELAQKLGRFFGEFLKPDDGGRIKYAIIIEGHTDSRASHEHNDNLSLARANSMIQEMIQEMKYFFTDEDQLSDLLIPVGYGERKLKIDEPYEEGYAENRRVEIKLIPKFDTTITNFMDKYFYN